MMSQASFNKYSNRKITKYEPKHKWICLNLIMETTLKLIKNPLEFNINDSINIGEFAFDIPFVQCLISKIHKKLRLIISKETVESLWDIAKIVFEYQSNKSQLNKIIDYLSDFDCDDESIENDECYIYSKNKVGKYKSMLKELGFKTKYIPNCVKFYDFKQN